MVGLEAIEEKPSIASSCNNVVFSGFVDEVAHTRERVVEARVLEISFLEYFMTFPNVVLKTN